MSDNNNNNNNKKYSVDLESKIKEESFATKIKIKFMISLGNLSNKL